MTYKVLPIKFVRCLILHLDVRSLANQQICARLVKSFFSSTFLFMFCCKHSFSSHARSLNVCYFRSECYCVMPSDAIHKSKWMMNELWNIEPKLQLTTSYASFIPTNHLLFYFTCSMLLFL